jgi:hypothetical protein
MQRLNKKCQKDIKTLEKSGKTAIMIVMKGTK